MFALIEMRQETDYVLHHAQKVIAIFAGMRELARLLQERGHRVHYLSIDDPSNQQSLTANLDTLLARYACTHFEYQEPDEWRLDQQLQHYANASDLHCAAVSSEHFYTTRLEVATLFAGQKTWIMKIARLGRARLPNPQTDAQGMIIQPCGRALKLRVSARLAHRTPNTLRGR